MVIIVTEWDTGKSICIGASDVRLVMHEKDSKYHLYTHSKAGSHYNIKESAVDVQGLVRAEYAYVRRIQS